MSRTRLVIGPLLLALVSFVALGSVAAPAEAATGQSRARISIHIESPTSEQEAAGTKREAGTLDVAYGQTVKIYGFTESFHDGAWWMSTMGGKAYVQQLQPNGTWADVRGPFGSAAHFDGIPTTQGTSTYRVRFTGGTVNGTTYPAAWSTMVTVAVHRVVTVTGPRLRGRSISAKLHVSPGMPKQRIVIRAWRKGKWRRFDKVRLNRSSAVRVLLPASNKGKKYLIVMKGDAQFARTEFPLTMSLS
ncbi:hypothetical protein FHP29_20895 [Nocardioides albidus]|uniref:Uncharacterized protein n=1 Tax=Nocardioides albidus TaxID=1517589 RepID=A0A5C4VLD8_9ACTN|nr:hypothetical protein [Nocardioides albidus]TNM36587.1 hypothetical protein FHP29_20895 [Nocardioides albidus]